MAPREDTAVLQSRPCIANTGDSLRDCATASHCAWNTLLDKAFRNASQMFHRPMTVFLVSNFIVITVVFGVLQRNTVPCLLSLNRHGSRMFGQSLHLGFSFSEWAQMFLCQKRLRLRARWTKHLYWHSRWFKPLAITWWQKKCLCSGTHNYIKAYIHGWL